jgi:virginiamycin A acetyltransferase
VISLLKSYLKRFIFKKQHIDLDSRSYLPMSAKDTLCGSDRHKITIRNSRLSGIIRASEGCKFQDCICSGDIEFGRFVSINGPGTRISSRINGIQIKDFCSIASNVIIQENYHRYDKVSTYYMNNNIFKNGIEQDICSKGKIIIEEDVWVGSQSVVLSGVTIGRGSVIGAGTIVTKDIPRYSIAAGNPAVVIKKRFSDTIISCLERSKWWERDMDYLKDNKELFNLNLNKEYSVIVFPDQ